LADITQNVGAGVVDVVSLVPVDGDAHVYEPTPADGVRLNNAVAIVQLGLGFESWFDDLYAASGSSAPVIVASRGLITRTGVAHADEADAHGHDGEIDPHVWHDVTHAMRMVETIRDELSRILPEQRDTINANAQAYLSQLNALDTELATSIASIPQSQRILVTNHDTFQYFAARYGFTVLGSALGSMTTESADPSAGSIAKLADEIRASGVPVIFVENVANPKLIEQLATAAGVRVAPPLYTDALNSTGEATTYTSMMRYNVNTIVTAFTATTP
jgi:ABC-type Zn uptake system ZnuABC Zn-binding protein ZnuA